MIGTFPPQIDPDGSYRDATTDDAEADPDPTHECAACSLGKDVSTPFGRLPLWCPYCETVRDFRRP